MRDLNESDGVASFNMIKKYIRESHLKQLSGYHSEFNNIESRSANDYSLLEWLGAFDIDSDQFDNVNDLVLNFGKMGLVENEKQNEIKIQFNDAENQYLNNERMLEDDFMAPIKPRFSDHRHRKTSPYFINYEEITDMSYYFNEISDNCSENINYLVTRRKKFRFSQGKEINETRNYFEGLKSNCLQSSEIDDSENIWRLSSKKVFFVPKLD